MPVREIHPVRLSAWVVYGVPIATILLTGLAVYLGIGVIYQAPWSWHDLWQSLGRATAYVSVMWPVTLVTACGTLHRWPLRSALDVARHVGTLVATTLVAFAFVTAALRVVDGQATPLPVFLLIAAVAAGSTAVLATIVYGAVAVQRLRASEAAAVAAELRALRAQINPHFLFNALNTIAALVRTRPDAAERVTEDLADLFRYSLSASERDAVSLAEEVASVRLFLDIEQARYGDDLSVEIDIPDELASTPVPSLILQPLVENAVKHGVRTREGQGTVRVEARSEAGRLTIRVSDTGPGFGAASVDDLVGRGTGLTNVAERLRAAGAELAIDDAPGGVLVLRFPSTL